MKEFDDLHRAWADLKAALRETQPFKAVYAAALWTMNTLAAVIERIGENTR